MKMVMGFAWSLTYRTQILTTSLSAGRVTQGDRLGLIPQVKTKRTQLSDSIERAAQREAQQASWAVQLFVYMVSLIWKQPLGCCQISE